MYHFMSNATIDIDSGVIPLILFMIKIVEILMLNSNLAFCLVKWSSGKIGYIIEIPFELVWKSSIQ